jgi:hypothetical protein
MKSEALIALALCAACIATAASAAPVEVTASAFKAAGHDWPLKVPRATVGCTGMAYWVQANGRRYGLNGFAGRAQGFADIHPIWRPDPEFKGSRGGVVYVSIGRLIDAAAASC